MDPSDDEADQGKKIVQQGILTLTMDRPTPIKLGFTGHSPPRHQNDQDKGQESQRVAYAAGKT